MVCQAQQVFRFCQSSYSLLQNHDLQFDRTAKALFCRHNAEGLELAVRPYHGMALPGICGHSNGDALGIGAPAQDRPSGIKALRQHGHSPSVTA